MKTLYLIRHAKSDWSNTSLLDIDRPLNARGYNDAIKMSLFLKEKHISPDLIITSAAIRAISTALIFSRSLNYKSSEIAILPELYETSVKKYVSSISKIDNKFKNVFLFAHNPFITDTGNQLSTYFTDNIPTCGIAGISFECTQWSDLYKMKGKLILHEFPKSIASLLS